MSAELVKIEPLVSKSDADSLRAYANMMERGELEQYMFVAEARDGHFLYSYASARRTHLLGLISWIEHKIHSLWKKEVIGDDDATS